jgi:flagellar biosynthesis protein FlhA
MIARFLRNNKDLALVACMLLILIVLFAPIPAFVLDLSILLNFGLALTILLLTFYVSKPTDFSTFPSLLLIATLFRLALNVATTRLILSEGYGGEVIGSIGTFAVAGNYIVGFVVFLILVIVQFAVVTSGAQRVSEVAARFTLDSMPGQQMSIDADLNMGLIDPAEAVRRREELEREAAFYGSMDGASKFVKGDAIAGVIILLINIIAGWVIGVTQMGMNWSQSLQHFTLLTIGDGIAAQLPALIIAIATGIIVTRSSADKELTTEVFRQLFSVPRIPLVVALMLVLLMLLPGMPKWPIVLIAGFGLLVWYAGRRRDGETPADSVTGEGEGSERMAAAAAPALEIALGAVLFSAWKDQQALILDRITSLRKVHEETTGAAIPPVRLVDARGLAPTAYEIRVFGTAYAGGDINPGQTLAIRSDETSARIAGTETLDPAFGLPATWIDAGQSEEARAARYTLVDPVTVLVTHLAELIRAEAATLMTRSHVVQLLEDVRQRQPGLVEELLPSVLSVADIQRILQNLLAEGVSIRNVDLIIEYLADLARSEKDTGELTELVRQRMSYAICNQLRERHRDLAVLSLDPVIENQIMASLATRSGPGSLGVEPRLAEKLLRQLGQLSGRMHLEGRAPVLLCSPEIRRPMRTLTRRSIPKLSILSVNEIPMNIDLRSYDIVTFDA